MSNNKILFLLLGILLITGLAGCGRDGGEAESRSGSDDHNRLIFASEGEYDGLNPILEETNLDALLFRGLFRFNENNEPVKDIAKSYEVSDDRKTYTFTLNKDVQFHDGKPLTVDDVIFTIESIVDDKNASFLKTDFAQVEGLKKIDDYKFEMKLKHAFTPILDKLTVAILPKHAFEGVDMRTADFNRHPIGAGPYQFKEWDRGNSLTLTAFENFHGTKPSIQTVIFKFIPDSNVRALQLASGEVDLTLLDPVQVAEMEKQDNLKIYDVKTADYRGILLNMKHDLWRDVRVRQAFSYAVNRNDIVEGILKEYGEPAYAPLQKHPFHNNNVETYEFNIGKANELLDEAGWKLTGDGFRYKDGDKLSFTITSPASDAVRTNIANFVAEGFKEIGADVQVAALDWSAIEIDQTDAFMVGWGSPYDADHHTYSLFHSSQSSLTSSGYNYGSYANDKVDKLLEEGRLSVDPEERKALYGAFEEELAKDPAFIFIAYVDAVFGLNEKIEGVKEKTLGHHGSGFLWNVEEWKWSER